MKIIEPSVRFLMDPLPAEYLYGLVERAGRTCYKSERREGDTAEAFIARAMARKHEAILEHATISLVFICDRGVSHEIVRHRVASYCQESTRYCNYGNDKFGSEISVIRPCWFKNEGTEDEFAWKLSMKQAEASYMNLLDGGWSPQQARAVLPNSLKTEIVVTMNIREWRHFFNLRLFGKAGTPHPQIVEVAKMAYDLMMEHYPAFFSDLG